ncbi:MAG: hypothetical protein SFZ02_10735 [bacterium]|nr:hypothetical protein [bacterium]
MKQTVKHPIKHPIGWMAIAAFSMVISISASITLATSDAWWSIALSRLSIEPWGFVFSAGFVISAVSLAVALNLQMELVTSRWKSDPWRLHGLRGLLWGLCGGLMLIGLFPDREPWLGWHRLGGWISISTASLISLGVNIWLPIYPRLFKRFSLLIGILPYGALIAYLFRFIPFTMLELFLLFLGAIWMTVFYAYTRVYTGQASPDILEEGGD